MWFKLTDIAILENCNLCPRRCGVNRQISVGYCESLLFPEVASICIHRGEEPVLSGEKGSCNVFFAHCNLQCCYCQNIDISKNTVQRISNYDTIDSIVERIQEELQHTENIVGFVSPSHVSYCIPPIVDTLHAKGIYPTIVYNTNAYDSIETLRKLEPYIDVYLPDFKYCDNKLAKRYSQVSDYFEVASKAIQEMYRQKGSTLITNDREIALSGLLIRHLMLPGCVENSKNILQWIADNLSINIHMSLMSQYFPLEDAILPDALNRYVSEQEYKDIVNYFYSKGFHKGWVQDLHIEKSYKPDFSQKESFEK